MTTPKRTSRASDTRGKQLPWIAIAVVMAVLLVVSGVAVWQAWNWLDRYAEFDKTFAGKDFVASKLDSVKIGLTIVAGGGALVALYLAVRRQRTAEQDLRDRQAAQQHIELDAAARRVTELYTRAADQLGSGNASVRLAGFYALERLAQDNPNQRQTIVNLWCSYLRMPRVPQADNAKKPHSLTRPLQRRSVHRRITSQTSDRTTAAATRVEARMEHDVRTSVQRLLTDHLHPRPDANGRPTNSRYWPEQLNLDLTEATLTDFRFEGCTVASIRFDRATFHGDAWFDDITVNGDASFDDTTFTGDASFSDVKFATKASFRNAKFTGSAWFRGASFTGDAVFDDVTFSGVVFGGTNFIPGAKFGGHTSFHSATFTGHANFNRVTFNAASFRGATFTKDTRFDNATFARNATFAGVTFADDAIFSDITFDGDGLYNDAKFLSQVSFFGSNFAASAFFHDAVFAPGAWFGDVRFGGGVDFGGSRFESMAACLGAKADLDVGVTTMRTLPSGWTCSEDAVEIVSEGRWGLLVPVPVVLTESSLVN
ncbi:pentapeptide repeat-containing protein [Amycolatopsis sp. lyj-23]|uniref:pentapeptide repeat-containing protein n=1 Tax=Amycolatopsis sp. lyj-23 TaxID=2789283 RepID=UPI00397C460D